MERMMEGGGALLRFALFLFADGVPETHSIRI
jgi:hypothetical protein